MAHLKRQRQVVIIKHRGMWISWISDLITYEFLRGNTHLPTNQGAGFGRGQCYEFILTVSPPSTGRCQDYSWRESSAICHREHKMASGTPRPLQATPQKLRVPRTPLESRQGYHPKKVRFYTRVCTTHATTQSRSSPTPFIQWKGKDEMLQVHCLSFIKWRTTVPVHSNDSIVHIDVYRGSISHVILTTTIIYSLGWWANMAESSISTA